MRKRGVVGPFLILRKKRKPSQFLRRCDDNLSGSLSNENGTRQGQRLVKKYIIILPLIFVIIRSPLLP